MVFGWRGWGGERRGILEPTPGAGRRQHGGIGDDGRVQPACPWWARSGRTQPAAAAADSRGSGDRRRSRVAQKAGADGAGWLPGTSLDTDNPIVADIRDRDIGGVVLFSYDVGLQSPVRNVRSPAQVAVLDTGLRDLAATPLLIAADQEGAKWRG